MGKLAFKAHIYYRAGLIQHPLPAIAALSIALWSNTAGAGAILLTINRLCEYSDVQALDSTPAIRRY